MTQKKQILEVSYGDFSCRLEGFDDSVETMKSIVAYFNDMVADEAFGSGDDGEADLEQLSEFAGDLSGQDVEATTEGSQINLRVREPDAGVEADDLAQTDADEASVVSDDLDDKTIDEDVEAALTTDEAVDEDLDGDADAPQPDVAEATEPADIDSLDVPPLQDETVEEILSEDTELHDVEETAEADFEPETDVEAEPEPQAPETIESPIERIRRMQAAAQDAPEAAPEDDDVALTEAPAETGPADEPDAEIDPPAEETDPQDTLQAEEDADALPDTAEPEPEVTPRGRSNPLAHKLADLARRKSYIRMPMDGPSVFDIPGQSNTSDAEPESEAEADAGPEAEAGPEATTENDSTLKSVTQVLATANTGSGTPPEAFAQDDDTAETSSDVLVLDDSMADDGEDDEDVDLTTLILRSRDALGEHTDTLLKAAERAEEDDDFDLGAEIAKVEAEIAARNGNEVARHGLPRHVEDAMSRIFSETNQHLENPSARRNRDAFAQLKAAVAATEAAKKLGEYSDVPSSSDEDDDADAFETSQRTAREPTRQIEPQPEPKAKVPPLKLVKSDLVKDTEDALDLRAGLEGYDDDDDFAGEDITNEPEAPVSGFKSSRSPLERPERTIGNPDDPASERLKKIAATKSSHGSDEETGFHEFTQSVGARTNLVDMMEAAGAYICFEKGEVDFARPRVIKLVQESIGKEVRREDGLRCFGRLLRQGRFIKTESGRFQIAADSKFGPNGDAAAQG